MSKKISIEEVEYTAELARLELSPEKLKKMAKDLDGILGYFDDLAEADTSKNIKINHYDFISERKNHFREDEVVSADEKVKEGIKNNFPARQGDLLAVKSVLTKK